jgi:hypothetical protein
MKLFKSIKELFKGRQRFPNIITDWHSAGIIFTSNDTILVGFKNINENWLVSGFGGKKEDGELYYQTAIRETMEELYEVPITKEIIEYIANTLTIIKAVDNEGYILMICDISQLKVFMLAGINFQLDTPIYDTLPYSTLSLIGNRKNRQFIEYKFIGFLPISMIVSNITPLNIDPNLISDIKYIE